LFEHQVRTRNAVGKGLPTGHGHQDIGRRAALARLVGPGLDDIEKNWA
jgi:hypothetical protein